MRSWKRRGYARERGDGGVRRVGRKQASTQASDGGRQRGFLGADADSSWERRRAWAIRAVEAAWGVGRLSQWAAGPGAAPGVVRGYTHLQAHCSRRGEDDGSNGGAQLVAAVLHLLLFFSIAVVLVAVAAAELAG